MQQNNELIQLMQLQEKLAALTGKEDLSIAETLRIVNTLHEVGVNIEQQI